MRRLWMVCAFIVVSLSLVPARADAYIWAWLDDLSGPQFAGFLFELQVKCYGKYIAEDRKGIGRLLESNKSEGDKYRARPRAEYPPAAYVYLDSAQAYIDRSSELLNNLLNVPTPGQNAGATIVQALAWKLWASQQFDWAERLRRGGVDDPLRRPGVHDVKSEIVTVEEGSITYQQKLFIFFGGINMSACDYEPLQRDDTFFRLSAGVAVDIKDDHEYGKNWMATIGASYHKVIAPWLSFGYGAGLARFYPSDRRAFSKIYVQPWIFDGRPGTWVKNADYRNAWRHVVYVRYSAIYFPQGFAAGQFHRQSVAYSPELVHAVGLHFDLSPMLRQRKGTW